MIKSHEDKGNILNAGRLFFILLVLAGAFLSYPAASAATQPSAFSATDKDVSALFFNETNYLDRIESFWHQPGRLFEPSSALLQAVWSGLKQTVNPLPSIQTESSGNRQQSGVAGDDHQAGKLLALQVGFAFLCVLILILFWNRRLQLEIARRRDAEQQLQYNRDLLEEAQSQAHIGNWQLDPESKKAIWSAEIYRIMGIEYTPDVGPEKLASLLHPDDRDAVMNSLDRAMTDGCRHHMEYRIIRPDGEERWIECQASQMRENDGHLSGIRGVVQDITKRKNDELKLLESEAGFRALAEAGFEAIFISENGVCISQNTAAEKLFGYSRDQAIGKDDIEWFAPQCRQQVIDYISSADGDFFEAVARHRDGHEFPVEIRIRNLEYQDRQVTVIAILDITMRRQIEDSLRQSEEQYRLLAENVTDVVWIRDLNLKLTYISPSVELVSGFTVEEKLASKIEDSMPPDSLAAMQDVFMTELAKERSGHGDPHRSRKLIFEMYRKDGSIYTIECVVSFLRDDEGNVIGIIGVNRDISERVEAEKAQRQSEEKYRTLVESSPYCIHQLDKQGRFISMNRTGLKMLGLEKEEQIIGRPYIELVSDNDRSRISEAMQQAFAGEMLEFEFSGGGGYEFSSNFVPIMTSDSQVDRLLGISVDITERKRADRELQKLSRAVESSSSSVIITNADGNIEYVNPRFCENTGYTREEVEGKNPRLLKSDQNPEHMYTDLWNTILSGGEWKGELQNRKKDGSFYWARNSISGVKDERGEITHIICIQDDVTSEYEMSEKLSYQASHDVLTGLINRREFERRVERVLHAPEIESTEHALCFMDLDQFKVVNDTCGHTAGDEMLRQIGSLLQQTVRKRDTLARLGGDEFGVLMEHCSLDDAHRVTTDVLRAIQDFQFSWQDYSFKVGMSIGLVSLADVAPNMTELLKCADSACYLAKDLGRNRIHVYHSDDLEIAQRYGEMQWVNRITRALDTGRFHLYAQPIIPLIDNSTAHHEVLIRMLDDEDQIIPPGAFLPAAERYNLITRIDRWVINETFEFLQSHQNNLQKLGVVSINLSGQSLADNDFQNYVVSKFKSLRVPPERICFEITETAVISSLSTAMLFIAKMKALGCRFSLDDFGSGLSSFAYLKNLNVDYLKIDGMFVKDIIHDPIDRAMVKSINEIGQVMGIRTIAEFVENKEIKGMLIDIGVDFGQGYGLGKPVPIESLILTESNNEVEGWRSPA